MHDPKKIHVLFVDLAHLFNDPHGIYSMSAVFKAHNIDVHYVGTRRFGRAVKAVQQYKPDLLLYSSFSGNLSTYIAFDRLVKKHIKVVSLLGGPAATYDWQRLKGTTIDAVCIGEGELATLAFIENGFKPVKNVFHPEQEFPRDFFPLVNLNDLPFPDRSVVYNVDSLLRQAPSKQFFSGRGCPYACTYCFNHQFRQIFQGYGPVVRKKKVDVFIAEILEVKKQYPFCDIVFNDDTFIIDKAWFLEFADRFAADVAVSYTCNIRADLMDEEIAVALKKSGCRGVNWSIESGNEYLRNAVLKRQMTDEDIYHAADVLRRHNVPFRTGNMLALPGETFAQMLETVSMNIHIRPQFALPNLFVPFPGLALTQYAIAHHYYIPRKDQNVYKNYFTTSSMESTSQEKKQIYKLFCLFPLFVGFPVLFQNVRIRKFLFSLPCPVLRVFYEIYYTYCLASFYTPKAPWSHKIRMAKRYVIDFLT